MSTNQNEFVKAMAGLGHSMGHPEVDRHMELKAAANAALAKQLEAVNAVEEGKKPSDDLGEHPNGAPRRQAGEAGDSHSGGDSSAQSGQDSETKGEDQKQSEEMK